MIREGGPANRGFHTTHWSLVLDAGDAASPTADASLAELCQAYWRPLYVYIRSRGHPAPDAQDLTQQFFARLLERNAMAAADPARGRFRTFLLTSLQRFLVSEWRKDTAARRDVSRVVSLDLAWDSVEADLPWSARNGPATTTDGPNSGAPPEVEYDREWADAVLVRALGRLRDEYAASGRLPLLDSLESFIWGRESDLSHETMAARLGLTEGAVRVAVHRLRSRFRDLLRSEVATTVASPDEIDAELRHLVEILVRK